MATQPSGMMALLRSFMPIFLCTRKFYLVWKAGKLAKLLHGTVWKGIQFNVSVLPVCIDQRGMMVEVTSALTAVGLICSCVAEIDRRKGLGVCYLFHIEGASDNLFNVCLSVDVILGVLGWSCWL